MLVKIFHNQLFPHSFEPTILILASKEINKNASLSLWRMEFLELKKSVSLFDKNLLPFFLCHLKFQNKRYG